MPNNIDPLELELQRLSRAVRYPDTPQLAHAFRRALAAERARPLALVRPWALGLAAAGVALALALGLGLWPQGRDALAEFFDRLHIFRTEESPAGLPTEIIGTPVALSEVEGALGMALRKPTYPEGLDLRQVLYQQFGETKGAVLLYEGPSGLSFALFEIRGFVGKGLAPGAQAEPVAGLGIEAYWLQGLRIIQLEDEQGNVIQESRRATDANTLVWAEDGFVFRLEGDLSQEEAIRIAQSLR